MSVGKRMMLDVYLLLVPCQTISGAVWAVWKTGTLHLMYDVKRKMEDI